MRLLRNSGLRLEALIERLSERPNQIEQEVKPNFSRSWSKDSINVEGRTKSEEQIPGWTENCPPGSEYSFQVLKVTMEFKLR